MRCRLWLGHQPPPPPFISCPPVANQALEAEEKAAFDPLFLDGKLQRDRILAKRGEMQREMERLMAKEKAEKVCGGAAGCVKCE